MPRGLAHFVRHPTLPLKLLQSRRFLVFSTAFLWWLAGAYQIFPLGWIALVPYFLLLEKLPRRARFRSGYLTGFVSFALINWWLIPTITRGAPAIHAPVFAGFFLSILAVTLIAAIHALQPAVVALLWGRESWYRPLLVAFVWALGDWVRTLSPIAHEWGALAFSQTTDLPFLQVAAFLGQHGLTFFCAFFAACLAQWWVTRSRQWIVIPIAVMVVLHVAGFIRLQHRIDGDPLNVMVVQTAISSLSKSGMATGESPFYQAFRLSMEATKALKPGEKVDLIVWPETTANLRRFRSRYSGLDWEVWRREGAGVPLLMGGETTDEENRLWNEAILLDSKGETQMRAKTRLVPFGERAPIVEFLPFLQIFAPSPMLSPGDGAKTFRLGTRMTLDSQICFESCFPQRVRGRFLALLTNDEWFNGTEAPRQHRAMAIMRAVENGVPVVQSANGGYSFVVDPQGRLVVSTEFGLPQTLLVKVVVPR